MPNWAIGHQRFNQKKLRERKSLPWIIWQFELSFVTIWVEFCHNSRYLVWSQFEFCHNLSFRVLSWFEFVSSVKKILSLSVTIVVFEFAHNLSFWILSQFYFLSFATIWIFRFGLILSLVIICFFCDNLCVWFLSLFFFFNFNT